MIKDFFKDKVSISIFSLVLVIPFLALFVSSFVFPVSVSAAGSFSSSSSYSKERTAEILSYFYNNPYVMDLGFTPDNSYFAFTSYYSSGGVDNGYLLCIKKADAQETVFNFNSVQYTGLTSKPSTQYIYYWSFDISYLNNLGSYHFVTFTENGYKPVVYSHASGYQVSRLWQNSVDNPYPSSPFYNYIFDDGSYPVFDPEDYEVVNPFFSLDVDDFYTWLVNNDKIELSGSSGGVSVGGKIPSYIGTQKLKSFLTFYKNFGSSNQSFTRHIVDWFSFMNIVGQSKDNINVLKTTIDLLYQEYINYRSGTHAYWPTAEKIQKRQNIDTVTDDDNTTLITDDNSDPLDISILRDILRGVIAVSNNLNQGTSDIVSAINRLDFTVNVANDGGSGFNASDIWGSGSISDSENYLALTAAFMDKGVDVSAAENMQVNYLDNATQADSFTVSVVMPDEFVNGQFTEKTVTHTIDNTSKMYNTLILFRKLIAFAVVAYFAIRIRFELPYLIRGE